MKNATASFTRKLLAVACAGVLFSTSALAATVSVPDATAPVGGGATTPSPIPVSYTGDGVTAAYQCNISYPTAELDATVTGSGSGACSVNDGTGTIIVTDGTADNSPLGSTTSCNITFTVGAGATDGETYPIDVNGCLFSDGAGLPSGGPHTEDDGVITVTAAPPDADLTYNPAPGGTVTFPTGTSGNDVTAAITVTADGSSGSATVDNCSLSGTNASAFTINETFPITIAAGGSDTIDLTCTLANSSQTATLTCSDTDAGGSSSPSFTLNCPAGDPVPAPEYTSTPAPGSTLTCNGAPGSTTTTSVLIENTGFAGTGSDLTYSCATTGANFAITGGAAGTVPVGGSSTVTVQCTVPADPALSPATGTLDCTTNDSATAAPSYVLSAGIVTAPPPVPQPAIIPANSLWSKLALFGLLAGLGALVIGLRRH